MVSRAITLVVLLALFVSGCSQRVELVPAADLVGTWISADAEYNTSIALNADGTFEVEGLPLTVFSLGRSGQVDLSGEWEVSDSLYGGTQKLDLAGQDDEGAGYRMPLLVRELDGRTEIFFILGDPDTMEWLILQRSGS